jgi:DNA-binding SARP family transcriptional activator
MGRLTIRLFGSVEVTAVGHDGGFKIPASSQPLLSYLLLSKTSVDRDQLAETLWPDRDGQRARRCLSTAQWRLKQACGQTYDLIVPHGRQRLSFNWSLPHWLDVTAFRRKAAPVRTRKPDQLDRQTLRRLEQAAQVYRDDLLPGLDEDWAIIERERMREESLSVLNALARAYHLRGEPARALPHAQMLVRREPLREDAHRLVMRLYAQMGARAKAIKQYRICEGELGAELGVPPMDETRALFEAIADRGSAASKPAVARMRAARLDATLDAARGRLRAVRRLLSRSDAELEESLSLISRAESLNPRDPL